MDVEDALVGQLDQFDQLAARTPVRHRDGGLVGLPEEPDLRGGGRGRDADDGDVGLDVGQRHRGVDGRLGADEVQDELGPPPAEQRADVLRGVGVGEHDVVGADGGRQGQLLLGHVQGHDPGGRERPQELDRQVTQSARADDDRDRSRAQLRQGALDRVVRREAGVGERDGRDRVEVADGDQVARGVDDHEVREGARGTETGRADAQVRGARAVVLLALRAHQAGAAAPRAVDDDVRAHLDAFGARPELDDAAGALVAQGERQAVGVLVLGQAHDEVVGVADAGRGDLQQDLPGARDGLLDLDDLGSGSDGPVLDCAHGGSSSTRCGRSSLRRAIRQLSSKPVRAGCGAG